MDTELYQDHILDWLGSSPDNLNGLFSSHRWLQEGVEPWKLKLWARESIEPAMGRAPIVVLVFVGLWYINLVLLDHNKVNFAGVLGIKTPASAFTMYCGVIMAILYTVTMLLFVQMAGSTIELAITFFYGMLVIFIMTLAQPGFAGLAPAEAHLVENRSTFFRLCRNVIWPGQTIAFAEIVFADALTSMSKVFKDAAITIIAVYSNVSQTPITDLHEEGMLLVAVLASVPFLIRVRQCWVQFEGQHDPLLKVPIFLNIVKYMSAFPPIWLAAAATLGYYNRNMPLYIMLTTAVNSTYSFVWDIVMDWGFISFSRTGKCGTRQRFFYPLVTYLFVGVSNLVLRFAWAANKLAFFSGMDAASLVLCLELVEVFRRSVWNMYRIEWEIISVEARGRNVSKEDLGADSSPSEGDLSPAVRSGSSASLRV